MNADFAIGTSEIVFIDLVLMMVKSPRTFNHKPREDACFFDACCACKVIGLVSRSHDYCSLFPINIPKYDKYACLNFYRKYVTMHYSSFLLSEI